MPGPGFKFPQKKQRPNQHNSLQRPSEQSGPSTQLKPFELKRRQLQTEDTLDASFGYTRYTGQTKQTAFVFNIRETFMLIGDGSTGTQEIEENQAIDIYCLQEDGSTFKTTYIYHPYFLLKIQDEQGVPELEEWFGRYFRGLILKVKELWKEDLDLPNHLSGKKQRFIQVFFRTTNDLFSVRKEIQRLIDNNTRLQSSTQQYYSLSGLDIIDSSRNINFGGTSHGGAHHTSSSNTGTTTGNLNMAREQEMQSKIHGDKRGNHEKIIDTFIELREYDVPYVQRISIDTKLRCGLWYDFLTESGGTNSCSILPRPDLESRPQMRILAYDIETCKAPLKFPNSQIDQIMMISLMFDGQGVLITNRQIVSEDIEDFEYTPKPEFEGPFTIINTPNEKACLEAFLNYIKQSRPQVIVTYNGDFFDFPYVDARCQKYGISLANEIGIVVQNDMMSSEYKGRFIVHLDAFCWVQRDSYLPQGSQGLKAVTKAKLKYDPIEVDPEDMMPFARTKPKILAQYSVSDAVATYYLYLKYVHLFIFSLCTIIPLTPNDILRKGSGTLCETLLMVQAYEHNVIAPNKQHDEPLKFYQGHLLESETYVGGHVECLHSGVYRADIPIRFELKRAKLQELMDSVDSVLTFAITKEWKKDVADVTNYQEIRDKIYNQLEHLYHNPIGDIKPLIYHLDVGAMYPNIILTNRLQPYAMVNETICATCDYNIPDALCKRTLEWTWRGKYYVPTKADYSSIRTSLEFEPLSQLDKTKYNIQPNATTTFLDLHPTQQAEIIRTRIKNYARKVYRKLTEEKLEQRYATTCQREHPFYIDTVRAFRDRRYLYKELNKTWGNNLSKAQKAQDALREQQCKDMILLYDSMQLAHKCILNSFYGYVMRKGSRWSSMSMAGVVTRTGAKLIQRAEDLVCSVGKVLELDTDGIWCVLPCNFPENYTLKHSNGTSFKMSFPCSVLNHQVDDKHTNHQYHQVPDSYWKSEDNKLGKPPQYDILSECSIFFEVDGPYKAMVLPASQHEGKNIKKRYAVFNFNGSIAELKGFEIKRRGELKLIKVFQEDVFKVFLLGTNLIECYQHVGAAANKWLDVLVSRGQDLEDSVVFDLISENKSMSEKLEDYGSARSTSITCAKRLGEFLGPEMVKDKGLNVHFVIVKYPIGAPVSERAVPVKIWDSPDHIKKYYLKKWLNETSLQDFDIRSLLDWEYYTTRLNSAIQKIITIPAAFQEIDNPVPRVIHPEWLQKSLRKKKEAPDQNILTLFGSNGKNNKKNNTLQFKGNKNNTNTTMGDNDNNNIENNGIDDGIVDIDDSFVHTRIPNVKSVFEQFDAEERGDIEDIGNNNTNSKLHPMFKKQGQVTKMIKNDTTMGDNDNNTNDTITIDDDDDGNVLIKKSKKSTTTTTAQNSNINKIVGLNDEIEEELGAAPIGTVRHLQQQQKSWIIEARLRREARKRNQTDQLSTAQLVAKLEQQLKEQIQQENEEKKLLAMEENGNIDINDDVIDFSILDGDDNDDNDNENNNDINNTNNNKKKSVEEQIKQPPKPSGQDLLDELQRQQQQTSSTQSGLYKTWHILSIQPHTTKLGVFTAWLNVEYNQPQYNPTTRQTIIKPSFKMHKINFIVDRRIYVHSSQNDTTLSQFGTLVTNKILPQGVPTRYLYEIELDEVTWQRDKHEILSQILTIPHILGIYQHDLSLLFKTIIDLGNMVQGLDEQSVIFDQITKKPIPKIWPLHDLITHSNTNNSSPQINSFDRYLITPQDIYKTLQQDTATILPNTTHHIPSFTPILIFHRESNDLYLQKYASQIQLDRQRVFFSIFDPTSLEIVIIIGGPGSQAYQAEIAKQSTIQQTATHIRYLNEYVHEHFTQWFIASHTTSYYNTLTESELLLLQTSDINMISTILHKKLKITTLFSTNPKEAYSNVSTWLYNRTNSGGAPILPILNTTQDMALITSLLSLSQQQQQQQQNDMNQYYSENNLNKDYSLAFIIQSYPFLYTHVQLSSLTSNTSTEITTEEHLSKFNPNSSFGQKGTNNNTTTNQQQQSLGLTLDNPFSTLQWVTNSIQSMYNNITNVLADFLRRLHIARLIKVPLCNIPSDLSLYTIDILFARALLDHNHLIWSNQSSIIDNQSKYLSSANNNLNVVTSYSSYFGTYLVPSPGQGGGSSLNSLTQSLNSLQTRSITSGSSSTTTTTTELDLLNPQLMNPGCYRSICFDLELQDFTLNALMNYIHLPDQADNDTVLNIQAGGIAGTLSAENDKNNNNKNNNETPIVKVTTDPSSILFRILRTVISHLVTQRDHFRYHTALLDQQLHQITYSTQFTTKSISNNTNNTNLAQSRHNKSLTQQHVHYQHVLQQFNHTQTQLHHIELLINNLYRYITSSQYSILYDHMLHVYIHRILKKTLILMIKEISKLHTIIIYASFERVLICSDKTNIDIAVNRLNSVVDYVKQQPLFSKLQFVPTQVYYSLLFMDVYNYASIINQPPPVYDDDNVTYNSAVQTNNLYNDENSPNFTNNNINSDVEQTWNENELSQRFNQQLQLVSKQGTTTTSKQIKNRFTLDDSDIDDDDDVEYDDMNDNDNHDISTVDVNGTNLMKKRNLSRFQSMLDDHQLDFGQLNGHNNNNNDDEYEATLPIDNVIDDEYLGSDDDIHTPPQNDNDDTTNLVNLNDPLSPLHNNNKNGHNRQLQSRSKLHKTMEEHSVDLHSKRRKAKHVITMNDDEFDDEKSQFDDNKDNNDDDEYIEFDTSSQSALEYKKHQQFMINNAKEFFDDFSQKTKDYEQQQLLKLKRQKNTKAHILQAVAITEKGSKFSQDNDDDNDMNNNHNNRFSQFDQDDLIPTAGHDIEDLTLDINNNDMNGEYQQEYYQQPHEEWVVIQSWNIATFLPQYGEELFLLMVESFLKTPFLAFIAVENEEVEQQQQQQQQNVQLNLNNDNNNNTTSNIVDGNANKTNQLIRTMEPKKRHQWYITNLQQYLHYDIQQLLLEQISTLQSQQDEHVHILRDHVLQLQQQQQLQLQQQQQSGGVHHNSFNALNISITNINNDSVFPHRPGKYLSMNNVALEYIKLFCHVLSLDKYISEVVTQVKTMCLTKLQIQSFTQKSHYNQPCRTFVLPNVCCTKCGHTKDIDLCRDIALTITPTTIHDGINFSHEQLHSLMLSNGANTQHNHNIATAQGTKSAKWTCQYCHTPYNKAEIESRLLSIIQQMVQSYQLQDFICPKCKQMKCDSLSNECHTCSIPYVLSKTYRQQQQLMTSLYYIAKQHSFTFLEEMLQWTMAHR